MLNFLYSIMLILVEITYCPACSIHASNSPECDGLAELSRPELVDYGIISCWIGDTTYSDSAKRLEFTLHYSLSSGAPSKYRNRVHFILANIPLEGYSLRTYEPRNADWSEWTSLTNYIIENPEPHEVHRVDNNHTEPVDARHTAVREPDFFNRINIGKNYEIRYVHMGAQTTENMDRYHSIAQIRFNDEAVRHINASEFIVTDTEPGYRNIKLLDVYSTVTIKP